ALWEKYAAETGRSDDLLIVEPGGPHRFNYLDYEWTRAGAGAAQVESIVQLLMLTLEAVAPRREGGGDDSFWRDSKTQNIRSATHTVGLATGRMQLADMLEVIRTGPQNLEEVQDEETWKTDRACFKYLLAASAKLTSEGQR